MFAAPEVFTCIKDTIPRTKMQEKRILFLHVAGAGEAAFLQWRRVRFVFAQKWGTGASANVPVP